MDVVAMVLRGDQQGRFVRARGEPPVLAEEVTDHRIGERARARPPGLVLGRLMERQETSTEQRVVVQVRAGLGAPAKDLVPEPTGLGVVGECPQTFSRSFRRVEITVAAEDPGAPYEGVDRQAV